MKLSSLLHPNRITCGLAAGSKNEAPALPFLAVAGKFSRDGARGSHGLRGWRLVGSGSAGLTLQKITGSR
ncbi:MAG TPA: hypothetical protein VMU54_20070 [Planctomycetota bacterium]|nr:hypothetical protein [Planctomycetota bacterium]